MISDLLLVVPILFIVFNSQKYGQGWNVLIARNFTMLKNLWLKTPKRAKGQLDLCNWLADDFTILQKSHITDCVNFNE